MHKLNIETKIFILKQFSDHCVSNLKLWTCMMPTAKSRKVIALSLHLCSWSFGCSPEKAHSSSHLETKS